VNDLISAAWAPQTQKSYDVYLKKWVSYCKEHNIEPYQASHQQGIEFLTRLFHKENREYGYIAAARSALSAVLPKEGTESFGKSDSVSKLLRGVFKLRPSIPKHVVVYDPDSILNHMISLPGNKQLDLEILTKKLVTLLALLSGQRAQTINALNLNWHHTTGNQHTFYISKILKTTKPCKHQQPAAV